jgi:DNA uptake protein ComE-like DNA-binding protein
MTKELGYRMRTWIWALLLVVLLVAGSADAKTALIDINSATIEELKTLPGVRDAMAQAIVKNRPYENKRQLASRKVISVAAYRQIRDLIIARH